MPCLLENLAIAELWAGDLDAAAAHIRESIDVAQQIDFKGVVAADLGVLAAISVESGRPVVAARLLGAAGAMLEAIETGLDTIEERVHAAAAEQVTSRLGPEEAERERHRGEAWSPAEAMDYARSLDSSS